MSDILTDEVDFRLLARKIKPAATLTKLLYSNLTMTHEELEAAYGAGGLTGLIKRLEPFDIIATRQNGSTIYYSLTAKGFMFYRYLLRLN